VGITVCCCIQHVRLSLRWHLSSTDRYSPGWPQTDHSFPGWPPFSWVATDPDRPNPDGHRPLFSWVATDPDFDDKVTHSTLTRTLGPFRKLALYLPQILQQYNWKRVVVISSNYLHYGDVGRAIRKVLAETNFTVAHASDYYRPLLDSYIRSTLYKTSIEGRSTFTVFPCQSICL